MYTSTLSTFCRPGKASLSLRLLPALISISEPIARHYFRGRVEQGCGIPADFYVAALAFCDLAHDFGTNFVESPLVEKPVLVIFVLGIQRHEAALRAFLRALELHYALGTDDLALSIKSCCNHGFHRKLSRSKPEQASLKRYGLGVIGFTGCGV